MTGGVLWELGFFAKAFFLGFCMRMGYDAFLLLRMVWRHKGVLIAAEDFVFWMTGSVLMFGLLFRENNGTPRLFALFGVLAGMLLYHLGPSRLVCGVFGRLLDTAAHCRKKIEKKVGFLLKKMEKKDKI